jgi:hypothetical protein
MWMHASRISRYGEGDNRSLLKVKGRHHKKHAPTHLVVGGNHKQKKKGRLLF